MNNVEIREIVVDIVAAALVTTVIYQSIMLSQVSDELKTLSGVAGMYLFGKYTPNSV